MLNLIKSAIYTFLRRQKMDNYAHHESYTMSYCMIFPIIFISSKAAILLSDKRQ